jgi:CelD/BcsL family acetyltransferase involved in cellulose biosynthesis
MEISRVGDLWRALEAEVGGARFACSWAWTETWLTHYGDIVPHRFAVGRANADVCGLALLTLEVQRWRGMIRIRRLHLGTAGAPSGEDVYVCSNRLLVLPAHEEAFAAAILRVARRDRGWDELALDRFAPDAAGPLLGAWQGLRPHVERCPVVDLSAADETDGDVLATLRPRTRQQIRRSLRILGPVTTEVAETPEHALDILDELIELHQRRWVREGEPGAFGSDRFRTFQRSVVARLVEQDAAMLVRVRTGTATLGCVYHLREDDRALSYMMGLATSRESKVKPGFVSLAASMQACHDRAVREYDLLPEASGYKLELSNAEHPLVSATAARRRPRLVALSALRMLKQYRLTSQERRWRGMPGR